ncbi:hypothetical protein R3P38DRAFT_2835302 [Favolaschia claudopus]|uniref:F-box domain-containing protein n=1 Tax=Favolaschia claudopus TaxID=2862362 RepID=A0AAW0EEE5_9AGAR
MAELPLPVSDLLALVEDRLTSLETEYQDIERMLPGLRMEVWRMEKKAKQLLGAIAECNTQISDLTDEPTIFSLAPIRRVPPEILCEIFQWAVVDGYTRKVSQWVAPTAPWKLTHICRAWRDVTRGCVRLWAIFNITVWNDIPEYVHDEDTGMYIQEYYDPVTDMQVKHYCDPTVTMSTCFPPDALEAQLQLSQHADLEIEINIADWGQALHLSEALFTLAGQSHRWSRLTFKWAAPFEIFSLLPEIKGRLGRLQYLELEPRMECDYWPIEFAEIFSLAPRLREIDITTPFPEDFPSSLSLPEQQLTHVRLHGPLDLVLAILPLQKHTLVDVVIRLIESEESSSVDPPVAVELPYLKRLSLTNDWGCECLVLPRLQSLELAGHIINTPAILDRSQCHLQTLDLSYCDTYTDIVSSMKSPHTCSLSHLRVDLGYDREDFAKTILRALNSSDVLPKLASLDLRASMNRKFREDVHIMIYDAIEYRWNLPTHNRTLVKIRLSPDNVFSDDVRRRFQRLGMEGLDVNDLQEYKSGIHDWI